MASTSAWAVGSFCRVTSLAPRPTISPWYTTTAPKGPPPFSMLALARLMAARISISFCRSEEHTSELQSRPHHVCRLPLEKNKLVSVYGGEDLCVRTTQLRLSQS